MRFGGNEGIIFMRIKRQKKIQTRLFPGAKKTTRIDYD
jgi:hypothetical protein